MLRIITCLLASSAAQAAEPTDETPMYGSLYEAYKYEDGNRVLRYHGLVYLFRTSFGWNPRSTMCMKSSFLEASNHTVHRTIEYYGIPREGPELSYKYIVKDLWMKTVKPKHLQPYIYASEDKTLVDARTPEQPARTKAPQLPTTLAPRALEYEDITLPQNDYAEYVLYADDKCLLTGEYNQTERVACTLWVTEAAINNPLSHCNFMLTALCANPAYNAYKHEERTCKAYDEIIRHIR